MASGPHPGAEGTLPPRPQHRRHTLLRIFLPSLSLKSPQTSRPAPLARLNRHFYLAAQTDNWMAVIDVASMTVVEKIETGETPHPGSGATWSVGDVEYGATVHAGEGKVTIWGLSTNEMAGTVETAGAGLFIRASDHSPYVWADAVYAEQPNVITVFEKEPPFEVVGVIEAGVRTLYPEFTDDGAFVYVSDWDGNVVRVYDAETLEQVAEIRDIVTPTGIFNVARRLETLGH